MICHHKHLKRLGFLLALLTGLARPVHALERDELALICNKKVAASGQLARVYAQAHNIPDDHIIELDLSTAEQMPGEKFDSEVVLPLRQALLQRNLRSKIKCLVPFFGVPLRLAPRRNTPAEVEELKLLHDQQTQVAQQIAEAAGLAESRIRTLAPDFKPTPAGAIEQSVRRADLAIAQGAALLKTSSDAQVKQQAAMVLVDTIARLSGPAGLVKTLKVGEPLPPLPTSMPSTQPGALPLTPRQQWEQMKLQLKASADELGPLLERRGDPAARQRTRELVGQQYGLMELYKLLQYQVDYLGDSDSSSLDNELALLWVNVYPHKGPLPNPLAYRSAERSTTPVLMVMRLDGPQSGSARDIIMASKAIQRQGLDGKFVIDSRGLAARKGDGSPDAYGVYDQRLRDLADMVRRHTSLSLVSDDTDHVLPAHSQQNVALYCGWYSVRNYVPGCQFVPGAVAFHIASFELVSLRDVGEKGWCRGLLNDGVAATLGPVDEPYLAAFPDPVDFFGLLMTGKYTLAEVYWLTTPFISWRISMIGDPLYNPFQNRPAIKPEALPQPLRDFAAPTPPPQQQDHLPGNSLIP